MLVWLQAGQSDGRNVKLSSVDLVCFAQLKIISVCIWFYATLKLLNLICILDSF